MLLRRNLRLFLLSSLSGAAALGALLIACSDSTTSGSPDSGAETPGTDGAARDGSTGEDDGSTGEDGSKDAGTDAPRDANMRDANGPGATNDVCVFNYDCQSSLRCECDIDAGDCVCKPGARGTGKNGIDRCTSSNDCASALCLEGPPDSGDYCSDECASQVDCVGVLPECLPIPFLGKVCVRTPPK